jgi:molybdopterin molybdotransferase
MIVVTDRQSDTGHIRRAGGDFTAGQVLLDAGRRLGARELTLAAAMGHARLAVRRRPRVAILATGDELVPPGTPTGPDQIVCSNPYGVAVLAARAGADVAFLGIARDTREDLNARIDAAADADILVTIGGASVGDHDLVGPVLQSRGMTPAFWKIAMRPGKPLLYGLLPKASGHQKVLGLPGNPVSALICARVFLVPLIERMLGLAASATPPRMVSAAVPLEPNGPRTHYMRAVLERDPAGRGQVRPLASQDSSLLSVLNQADCLLVRPAGAPAAAAGTEHPVLPMDF